MTDMLFSYGEHTGWFETQHRPGIRFFFDRYENVMNRT